MAAKNFTFDEALHRAQRYCAFQERCTGEVKALLHKLGVEEATAGRILEELVREGFLDNGRFAAAYVRGKFRNNGWGRIRIVLALKSKQIDHELIEAGLEQIDEEEYIEQLTRLLRKKYLSETGRKKERDTHLVIRGIKQWAYGRGYEPDLSGRIIQQIIKEEQQ